MKSSAGLALLVTATLGACGAEHREPAPAPPPGPVLEPMRGPYPGVEGPCTNCELDVKIQRGEPPFDELTVLRLADGRTQLAVHVGAGWWFRDLGPKPDAPHQVGRKLVVVDGDKRITCEVDSGGTPACSQAPDR
jgi:hypothetical protein